MFPGETWADESSEQRKCLTTVTLGSWWFIQQLLLRKPVPWHVLLPVNQTAQTWRVKAISHITVRGTQTSVTVLRSLLTIWPEKVLSKHVSEASSIVKNTVYGFAAYSAPWKAAMQAMQSCFKTSVSVTAWPTFSRYHWMMSFRLSLKFQTIQVFRVFFTKVKSVGYLMYHYGFAFEAWPVSNT